VAYFSLDVALIDSYGLGDDAKALLVALGLWKIRRVLDVGMRFRTACDFEVEKLRVTRPAGWELPSLEELQQTIRTRLAVCKADGLIAEPAKTYVAFQ
jgi:CRISPR-associated protein Csb1